jgi:TatD DNase family protein
MIDTHCHLGSSRFRKDRAEVMARARQAGVHHFVEVAYDLPTSERSIALASEHEDMWASVGMHPHEVAKALPDAYAKLEALSEDKEVVAIGECGLDFYRDLSPRDMQREWFERQIELAKKRNLPLIVHVRDAMDEALDRLEKGNNPRAGIMHCWSGNAAQAKRAADMGYVLGIGGSLTYGDVSLEEAARTVNDEAIVLETDAPYLVPMPKTRSATNPP